jgi:hypothetical protein
LTLTSEPNVNFTVTLRPEQAAGEFAHVGYELKRYLERIFGKPVPWEQSVNVPVCLFLDPIADGGIESFTCAVSTNIVELRARSIQGLTHAIYWFLEKYFGVRWLWPGELGEVVPRISEVKLPEGRIAQEPDFYHRAIYTEGALWRERSNIYACYADIGATPEYFKEFDTWHAHNRMGGLRVEDGHRLGQVLPPQDYGEEHPDYFALIDGVRQTEYVDGKHGNHGCFCNPEVVDVMAEYCARRLDAGGEVDVFTIGSNDGHAMCECDLCHEFERQMGGEVVSAARHMDNVTNETGDTQKQLIASTDRMMWQANEIARKVKKTHPNKRLLALLYSTYRTPPRKLKLDEYVIGQFCIMGHLFYNEQIRQRELDLLTGMSPSVPALGIYEYQCNGAWPDLQRIYPRLLGRNIEDYHKAGARFFATQAARGFATNGINLYILTKKLWDVNADTAEIIDDYCKSGFGEGAKWMQKYFDAFEQRWQQSESFTNTASLSMQHLFVHELYPPEFLSQRRAEIEQARAAVPRNSDQAARVDFIARGLRQLEVFCEAMKSVRNAIPLDARGQPIEVDTQSDRAPSKTDVADAICALKAFFELSRQDDFQFVHDECFRYYRQGVDGEQFYATLLLREWEQALKECK